ncbi:DNA cytosine methyltransferase [Geovibrio sp. ADMFC3]
MKSVFDYIDRSERMDSAGELIVDLFAGGGGASLGIETALGMSPHIAINHDANAVAMHMMNHPDTEHFHSDIFEIDPYEVTKGRPVGLMWASPDCTHFSKAKGGKPVSKRRRGLAWVVKRWAGTVRPRVIIMENVEEFMTWGPLRASNKTGEYMPIEKQELRPDTKRKGKTYKRFIAELHALGYKTKSKVLCAADYGVPTIRKRWFLVARCDGQPITFPKPTHSKGGKNGLLPWIPVADIINWSLPTYSIFLTKEEVKERKLPCKRPLADKSMMRIAAGTDKFVVNNKDPYIVPEEHSPNIISPFIVHHQNSSNAGINDIEEPLRTVTAWDHHALVTANIMTNTSKHAPSDVKDPLPTVTTGNQQTLVTGYMTREFSESIGHSLNDPAGTITTSGGGKLKLTVAYMSKMRGTNTGDKLDNPLHTVSAGGGHHALVYALMVSYYGQDKHGGAVTDPLGTVVTKDRFSVVCVYIRGELMAIYDIGMRMLVPRELFRAQGFPDSYIIEYGANGKKLSTAAQVEKCGNSVCPPMAAVLVSANYKPMALEASAVA